MDNTSIERIAKEVAKEIAGAMTSTCSGAAVAASCYDYQAKDGGYAAAPAVKNNAVKASCYDYQFRPTDECPMNTCSGKTAAKPSAGSCYDLQFK